MRDLGFLTKYWFHRNWMVDTRNGFLSSFSVLMMSVYFLQQYLPVLPRLEYTGEQLRGTELTDAEKTGGVETGDENWDWWKAFLELKLEMAEDAELKHYIEADMAAEEIGVSGASNGATGVGGKSANPTKNPSSHPPLSPNKALLLFRYRLYQIISEADESALRRGNRGKKEKDSENHDEGKHHNEPKNRYPQLLWICFAHLLWFYGEGFSLRSNVVASTIKPRARKDDNALFGGAEPQGKRAQSGICVQDPVAHDVFVGCAQGCMAKVLEGIRWGQNKMWEEKKTSEKSSTSEKNSSEKSSKTTSTTSKTKTEGKSGSYQGYPLYPAWREHLDAEWLAKKQKKAKDKESRGKEAVSSGKRVPKTDVDYPDEEDLADEDLLQAVIEMSKTETGRKETGNGIKSEKAGEKTGEKAMTTKTKKADEKTSSTTTQIEKGEAKNEKTVSSTTASPTTPLFVSGGGQTKNLMNSKRKIPQVLSKQKPDSKARTPASTTTTPKVYTADKPSFEPSSRSVNSKVNNDQETVQDDEKDSDLAAALAASVNEMDPEDRELERALAESLKEAKQSKHGNGPFMEGKHQMDPPEELEEQDEIEKDEEKNEEKNNQKNNKKESQKMKESMSQEELVEKSVEVFLSGEGIKSLEKKILERMFWLKYTDEGIVEDD